MDSDSHMKKRKGDLLGTIQATVDIKISIIKRNFGLGRMKDE